MFLLKLCSCTVKLLITGWLQSALSNGIDAAVLCIACGPVHSHSAIGAVRRGVIATP